MKIRHVLTGVAATVILMMGAIEAPAAIAASPASSLKSASYTDSCATGYVTPIGAYGYIKSDAKNSAPVLETVYPGEYRVCAQHEYTLGDRYNGCGVTDANGWVYVETGNGNGWGWAAMTCWGDD